MSLSVVSGELWLSKERVGTITFYSYAKVRWLTLREERRLRVFENIWVLRGTR